jgi:DNA-binding SARP family transcriptional activator
MQKPGRHVAREGVGPARRALAGVVATLERGEDEASTSDGSSSGAHHQTPPRSRMSHATPQPQSGPCYTGIEISTLGGLAVCLMGEDGSRERLTWRRARSIHLLWLLLCCPLGQTAPAEAVDKLWPDAKHSESGRVFTRALSDLRSPLHARGLGRHALVVSDRWLIRLRAFLPPTAGELPCGLDTLAFEDACNRTFQAVNARDALVAAQEAMRLYRGDFLPEATLLSWTMDRRGGLRAQWVRAAIALAEVQACAGQVNRALEPLERVLERIPDCVEVAELAMRLLARAGRTAEALALHNRVQDAHYRHQQACSSRLQHLAALIEAGDPSALDGSGSRWPRKPSS